MTDVWVRKSGAWVAASDLDPPSVFDPFTSIPWSAVHWAGSLSATHSSGDPVVSWPDLSGNGRHVSQAVAGKQPTFQSAGLGGHPAVVSDGGADLLSAGVPPSVNRAVTMVVIAQPSTSANGTAASGRASTSNLSVYSNPTTVGIQSSSGGATTPTPGGPTLFGGMFDSVGSVILSGRNEITPSREVRQEAPAAWRLFTINGTAQPHTGAVAFAGIFDGDATSHPRWGEFLSWAEDTYGLTLTSGSVAQRHKVIEGVIGGEGWQVMVPRDYSPAVGAPLVIYCHGNRQDRSAPVANELAAATAAMVDAGYIVACSDARLNGWGSALEVADYTALHSYVTSTYTITRSVLIGASMGGLPALHMLSSTGDYKGAYLIYPVCSLADAYTIPSLTPWITAHYGITGTTPYTYAERTAGRDPVLALDGTGFAGKRLRWSHGTSDVIAPKVNHTDVMRPISAPYAIENDLGITGTWGHGSHNAFNTPDILAFLGRCT